MKTILIFVTIFFALNCHLQLIQLPTKLICENIGSAHPQIELNKLGEVCVLWTDATSKNVYFTKNNGEIFLDPIQINANQMPTQVFTWSGPDLAIENNNVFVVYRSEGYETGNVYFSKSTTNGTSFSAPVRVDFLSEGYAQYPDISVKNDTIYVTYMQHDANSSNPRYVLSRSFDGGLTFESPILAGMLTGNEACDCCPPEIVVNDQLVTILFRNNANNIRDIKGVVSFDRGTTFTDIANIDNHNWNISACPSSGPDAKMNPSEKILYTIFKTSENSVGKVALNEFDLENNTSLQTRNIGTSITNPNYPQLALSNDTIGLVFEGIGTSSDVFFNYSYNGMSDLSDLNQINLTNTVGTQNKPDIVFGNGSFHIVYSEGNTLKYIQLVETAALNLLTNNNKVSDIIYSKSLNKLNFEKENYFCYNSTGQLISTKNILTLTCGNYYLLDKTSFKTRKLIILP